MVLSPIPLKIITFNMRKGKGDHVARVGMESLEAALAREAPDLVLLQEVFHSHAEAGWGQGEQLADHLSMELAYTPNNTIKKGHYGNATLSRHPITVFANHNISTNPVEKRGALYTRVAVGGRPVHLVNTHLGLNGRQRRVQVGHLEQVIASHVPHQDPLVVAGDFNDWTGSLRKRIRRRWPLHDALSGLSLKDRRTWHTRFPLFTLDHLYYTGLGVEEVRVGNSGQWGGLSDHFPIIAAFTLPGMSDESMD
ncbi:MAG: endonuclease/exonuclease/phosphatase family protein [Deltaproteobacteria bacterium]|nr:endonuclease/exonuclease/phosphatase family protein [Deltaproteobacteria bacterium]